MGERILNVHDFITKIETNKRNHDQGMWNCIPFYGSPKLNSYIPGMLQGFLYLVSSLTGVGKSKFLRGMFLRSISTFKEAFPNIPVNVTFFSLEETPDMLFTSFIAQELSLKFPGKRYNLKTLLSYGKDNTISDAEIQFIKMKADYFNTLVSHFDFQTITDIDEIYGYLYDKIMERGKMVNNVFINNNPHEFNIFFVDHIKLLTGRAEEKPTMNEWSSKMCIDLTKNFGYTGINIQQQGLSKAQTKNPYELEPRYEKLGEHKNSVQDSHFFIGLFQPSMYEVPKYLGYDLTRIGSNFRSAVISKNRLDRVITRVPFLLNPEQELWNEIPHYKSTQELLSFMARHGINDYFENSMGLDNYYEVDDAPF